MDGANQPKYTLYSTLETLAMSQTAATVIALSELEFLTNLGGTTGSISRP
jgi:hypothetical protein